MIPGIDVSVWQDDNATPQKPDFTIAAAQGTKFVFIRAAYGKYVDEDFRTNWENAKASGLLRGAYLYMTTSHTWQDQANNLIELLRQDRGEIPPVIDFEERGSNATNLLNILNAVEKALGVVPIIYTGFYVWQDWGNPKTLWLKYPLWLAAYVQTPRVPLPWTRWTFWQYTDRGEGRKYGMESAGLDLDWFNGTLEELYQLCGQTVPTPALTLEDRVRNLENWAVTLGYSKPPGFTRAL